MSEEKNGSLVSEILKSGESIDLSKLFAPMDEDEDVVEFRSEAECRAYIRRMNNKKSTVERKKKTEKKEWGEASRIRFDGEFKEPVEIEPFNLYYLRHTIAYKDQRWDMGERNIKYNMVLVKQSGAVKNIINSIGKISKDKKEEEIEMALRGETLWYEIKTFETVPYDRVKIGYVKIYRSPKGSVSYTRYITNSISDTDKQELKQKISDTVKIIMKKYMKRA